ncbi:hypothetical protein BH18ACT15_BH18ACT15_13860 [soil metagenome]
MMIQVLYKLDPTLSPTRRAPLAARRIPARRIKRGR